MEISNKLTQITQLGMLNYPVEKCINVLDIPECDEKEFCDQFNTPGTPVYKAYKKGVDQADFAIDAALFKKASGGDKKAMEMLEERKYYHQNK